MNLVENDVQPPNTDAPSLVERCRSGDKRAWNELFAKYAGRVHRWVVLLGVRSADVEDVAQEVLVTAARRIDTCENDAVLTTWLFQIARRQAANARRRVWWKRIMMQSKSIEPVFEPSSHRSEHEEVELRGALARLPAAQVEILLLVDVEGFTRDEAAEALGVPAGTVASRLRVARAAFAEIIEETGGDKLPPLRGRPSRGEP